MMNVITASLMVSFLWGLNPVINKHILDTLNPKLLICIEGIIFFFCLIFYGYCNWFEIKKDLPKVNLKYFLLILISAVVTGFLANVIYLTVLHNHESYVISALVFSAPFFTLILAMIFLKEKINIYGFVGVLLIVFGVICLAFNEKNHKELFVTWDISL